MKKGYSFSTFQIEAGVSRKTLYEWVDKHPEFGHAKELAFAYAQNFFEQRLSAVISGQKFKDINTKLINVSALIFALKTRFHETYKEQSKLEIDTSGKGVVFNIVKHENAK